MASRPLDAILTQVRAEPSRTWSIVVTLFGDAVLPRGGSLGLATVLDVFAAMDVAGGVVRTAMSRLAADGWVQRVRVGRHSFYRLTEKGHATFAAATSRIYRPPGGAWDGTMHLVLLGDGPNREATRRALEGAGFGVAASGAWVAPSWTPIPPEAAGAMRLRVSADAETAAGLARRAWPSGPLEAEYARFIDVFSPLREWLAAGRAMPELDALLARTLLIHQFRRVVLRDPMLPTPLLPCGWPGRSARTLCATIYGALVPASERWLDLHGTAEAGRLPPPATDLLARFA